MKLKDHKILIDNVLSDITPEMVAELFAEMYADEQAAFFNHVAAISSTWGGGMAMQLQSITDDDGLTLAGRRVMQAIGEYSHWGLVPQIKCVDEVTT